MPKAPVVAQAPLEVDESSTILRAQISRRCGALSVRYARETGGADRDAALLSLELEPLDEEVRVTNSSVMTPGRTRPALVACAQWAMRGVVLPAPGVEPGKPVSAFVAVGNEEAARRGR
jgi:hypothetical protein